MNLAGSIRGINVGEGSEMLRCFILRSYAWFTQNINSSNKRWSKLRE